VPPSTTPWVALLRGVNVGGRNLIRMADLKACFTRNGFADAKTYIQSGNVVFTASAREGKALAPSIEAMLTAGFAYSASVVVRSLSQMRHVVADAPDGFGVHPDEFRYDVIFLKEPLGEEAAMQRMHAKEGVDEAHAGQGVLYFSRLIRRAPESWLARLVGDPVYKSLTIRNWNTTTKLLAMMEGIDPG
jgi:uncharacterized protein (DUF1697 family)